MLNRFPLQTRSVLVAALVASLGVLAGCGGAVRTGTTVGVAPETSFDYYFFADVARPEQLTEAERVERIPDEIERLATPAWQLARDNLFRLGREAVPRLIDNLDRTERSEAALSPVPGPTVPEAEQTWTLGRVVYAVLLEFVGSYTDYHGPHLPPFDKAAWETWWARNRKRIKVYDPMKTAPRYVREQMAAVNLRFSRRAPEVAEKEKGRHARQREKEKKAALRAKQREGKRSEEKRRAERGREKKRRRAEEKARAVAEKRARAEEAKRAAAEKREKRAEETKAEETKAEETKVEESKAEEGKAEESKEEKPKRRSRRRRRR